MSDEDFLVRLKIASKVTTASNLKAAGLHFNKKSSNAAINKTAESAKSDFVGSARDFIKFLLSGVLQHTELGSDLIKGLAAFDPHILFRRPVEVALRQFDYLHSTFQLRSWVSASNESVCRDEYVALLDSSEPTIPLSSAQPVILLTSLTSSWIWSSSKLATPLLFIQIELPLYHFRKYRVPLSFLGENRHKGAPISFGRRHLALPKLSVDSA